jgi:hypothetical protein
MSTDLDVRLIPRVKSIVGRLGKDLTFHEEFFKDDDAAGTREKISELEHVVKCTPPEGVTVHEVSGDDIRMGDQKCFLPAQGLEFEPVDKMPVTIDDEVWRIVAIKPIRTGEDIAIYQLWMRK